MIWFVKAWIVMIDFLSYHSDPTYGKKSELSTRGGGGRAEGDQSRRLEGWGVSCKGRLKASAGGAGGSRGGRSEPSTIGVGGRAEGDWRR